MSIVWIIVGVLGFSFPIEALVKAPEPRLFSALHEMLFAKGLNRRVLYYVFPVVVFVALYSILPHKVWQFYLCELHCALVSLGAPLHSVAHYICARTYYSTLLSPQELRFIFPALPLLTMAGGVGLDSLLPLDSTGQCIL